MPILALIGLIISVISTAMKIVALLKDHPECTAAVASQIAELSTALETAQAQTERVQQSVESP